MAAPQPDPQVFYNAAYRYNTYPYAYTAYNGFPYYNARYYAATPAAAAYRYYY